jgi:type III restriction enzyme
MHIELRDYQEKAVIKLRNNINELLATKRDEVLIFVSPTGSGKTIMIAESLRRIIDSRSDDKKLAFIWIAVNKLHDQSRDSLKKYYDNEATGVKCSYFYDLTNREIKEKEILFLNWASVNKKDNLYIQANERDNNLQTVIARTKEAGRTIILIIDESHHTASSDKSKEIIAKIAPKVTIEVSATPQMTSNNIVPVRIDDVRYEGMIKKEVIVNDKFEYFTIDRREKDETADEIVLKSALEKRKELTKSLEKEGSNINPLLLIQLPDKKTGIADKKEEVLEMLKRFGYKNDDDRVAIYLTGKEKINLENIEKPQNEVEVMLFKQAIALGWDCPRAAILVLFRQWTDSNITFSIQTLGRIMRMPEHKHYKNSILNKAYLYTSLPDIEARIDQSDIKGDIKPFRSACIESYKNINLISWHTKRYREETRLSSRFVSIFLEAAKKQALDKKVSLKYLIPATRLIASGRIENTDEAGCAIEKTRSLDIQHNEVELQHAFDAFARDNLDPFYPEQRSIKRINESIYAYFGARRDEDRWSEIQAMVLADENKQAVIDAITLAKEMYQDVVERGKQELVKNNESWNVPESLFFDILHKKKDYKKSALQPYYAKVTIGHQQRLIEEDSYIETAFIEFLEKSNNIEWWFKNGVGDATFFAVPYEEHGVRKAFYVDFIIYYKDGRIGLFDTKGGLTAQTAKARAEGLAKYITEYKDSKHIFGGIIIQDGNSWRYHEGQEYKYNPNDLKDWKFLES